MSYNIRIKYLLIKIIRIYQKTLSFDHGWPRALYPNGWCRYAPTCSEYAIEAIAKCGIIKGGYKAIWRVLRCNPFSRGGYDPVEN